MVNLNSENKLENKVIIKSGEKFKETGCYSYAGHVRDDETRCFIPEQVHRMLFKRGEVAPPLISCYHDINWKLIFIY